MAKYNRKYDFQPGTRISSAQVDSEFDQLISATNDLYADLSSHLGNKSNPHNVTSNQINKISYMLHDQSGEDYPEGISFFTVSAPSDGSKWPDGGGYGTVLNIKQGGIRFSQFFYHATSNRSWIRTWYKLSDGSGQGWSAWDRIVTENFDGVLNLSSRSLVYLRKTNAQSISSGVDSKITFDTVSYDKQSEYANNAITLKNDGNYFLSVQYIWAAPPTGDIFLKLFKNGASFSLNTMGSATKVNNFTRILTDLKAGDKIEFYVNQGNAAATLNQVNLYWTKLT